MPPKRSRKRGPPSSPATPALRRSNEINEAFRLFATSYSDALATAQDNDDEGAAEELESYENEDHGIIQVLDVRRALKSLDLPPPPSDFFDEGQHYLSFESFQELANTMSELVGADDKGSDVMGVDEPEDTARRKGKGKGKEKISKQQREHAEIDHAFALFTTPIPTNGKFEPGSQTGRKITLADLKRVAKELREDVDDSVLKMMVLEANGGEGNTGVMDGVGREDFEAVMKRAGVFA